MEISLVISAVGLGLASGFHCIGMCGPIALSLGITRKQSVNFYLQNIIYQLGGILIDRFSAVPYYFCWADSYINV